MVDLISPESYVAKLETLLGMALTAASRFYGGALNVNRLRSLAPTHVVDAPNAYLAAILQNSYCLSLKIKNYNVNILNA